MNNKTDNQAAKYLMVFQLLLRILAVGELTVVLGVAEIESQTVQMFQHLFQGQLSQFTAGTPQTTQKKHSTTQICVS